MTPVLLGGVDGGELSDRKHGSNCCLSENAAAGLELFQLVCRTSMELWAGQLIALQKATSDEPDRITIIRLLPPRSFTMGQTLSPYGLVQRLAAIANLPFMMRLHPLHYRP